MTKKQLGALTPTERFARKFNIHIKPDEAGEPIMPGSRGHLYFDGSSLCLIGLNSRLTKAALLPLKGKLWVGDIHYDDKRRGFRDIEVLGIPEEHWRLAVKLCRCPRIRKLSPEHRAKAIAALSRMQSRRVGSNATAPEDTQGQLDFQGGL